MTTSRGAIDPAVRGDVIRLLSEGWKQTHIEDVLDKKHGRRAPSLRTINRIASEHKHRDPSGAWTVRDADPETADIVLRTLSVVMSKTDGRVRGFTNAQAGWIISVQTICPEMTLFEVFHLAWLYNVRESNNEETHDLDAYLAFKPWKSQERKEHYRHAIREGWIESMPAVLIIEDSGEIESRMGYE